MSMDDITFSLGLGADGLVASISQSEPAIKAALDAMLGDFQSFVSDINQLGSGNPFAGMVQSLAPLRQAIQGLRTDIRGISSTPVSLDVSSAMTQIAKLQASLNSLRAPVITPHVVTPALGGGLGNLIGQGQTLNAVFQRTAGVLRNVSTVLSTIGIAGGIFALVEGFKNMVEEGVMFNSQVEQAKIGMAAIVAATAETIELDGKRLTGVAAIEGVQGNVTKLVEQLKGDALFTNGTFQDLLKIAQSITGPVLKLGGSMDDVEKLTRSTAIAASVLGVNFEEATTGILQLLSGVVNRRNDLVKKLPFDFGSGEIKDASTRLNVLLTGIGKFQNAAGMLRESFTGASASLKDLMQQFAGAAFEPLERRLKQNVNSFLESSVSLNPNGGVTFSPEFASNAEQASRIIDNLTMQVATLVHELLGVTSGHTVLDEIEHDAPKVVDAIGSILTILKTVGSFLVEHAGAIATVLEAYLGMKIAVGIFTSIQVAIAQVGRVLAFVQSSAALLGVSLTALEATGVLAVAAAFVELGIHIYDAHKAEVEFANTLKEIGNLNFDPLISNLANVRDKLDHPGMIDQAVSALTENRNETWNSKTGRMEFHDEVKQGPQSQAAGREYDALQKARKEIEDRAHDAGLFKPLQTVTNVDIGKLIPQIQSQIIARDQDTQKLSPNDDRRRIYAGQNAEGRRFQGAIRTYLGQSGQFGDLVKDRYQQLLLPASVVQNGIDARTGLAYADLPEQAKTTFKPPATDPGIAQRENKYEEEAKRLLQANAADKLRILDAAAATAKEHQQAQQEQGLQSTKETAENQLKIAQDLAANKQAALKKEFQDMVAVHGLNAKAFAALGLTDEKGNPYFDKLASISPEALDERQTQYALAQEKAGVAKTPQSAQEGARVLSDFGTASRINKDLAANNEAFAKAKEARDKAFGESSQRSSDLMTKESDALATLAAKNNLLALEVQKGNGDLEHRVDILRTIADLATNEKVAVYQQQVDENKKRINDNKDLTPAAKAQLNSGLDTQTSDYKAAVTREEQLAVEKQIYSARAAALQLGASQQTVDENNLEAMKAILGQGNALVVIGNQALVTEKLKTLEAERQLELRTAQAAADLDDQEAAQQHLARAAILQSEQTKLSGTSQETGVQQSGDVLTSLGSDLSGTNKNLVGGLQSLGKALQVLGSGNLEDTADTFSQAKATATAGGSGNLMGDVAGVAAAAGPIGQAVGSVVGMFQTFFSMFDQQMQIVLEQVQTNISMQISSILNTSKVGGTTDQEIAGLQGEIPAMEQQLDAQKINGFLSFFTGTNAGINQEIQQNISSIEQQIQALQLQAQDAAYSLQNVLLPTLSVTPGMQSFEQQLLQINTQLQGFSGNSDISSAQLQSLFQESTGTLQVQTQQQILSNQQNYVQALVQEQNIKLAIAQLNEQELEQGIQYTQQRDALLGISVTQLSKAQQIQQLDTNYQLQQQANALQAASLQNQLNNVTDQVTAYQQVYGIVQDIGAYQAQVNAQNAQVLQDNIVGLQQFYQQLEAYISAGNSLFNAAATGQSTITLPNGTVVQPGGGISADQVYAILMQLINSMGGPATGLNPSGTAVTPPTNPTPISITPTTSTSGPMISGNSDTITNVTIGTITIGQGNNLSPQDVVNAVRTALQTINTQVGQRGLAYGALRPTTTNSN